MKPRTLLLTSAAGLALVAGAAFLLADQLEDTWYVPGDHPAIQYTGGGPSNDPVAKLDRDLESGKVKLDYAENGFGYLPAILKLLNVPIDSQLLVFSKGSIQAEHIWPIQPRAIYFNDQVSVGYVQGADVLEFSSVDPKLGPVMYVLNASRLRKPGFGRSDEQCLRCHQGPITMGVPGMVISSVRPRTGDQPDPHGHSYITDHTTPFVDRWGGWYVTGTHGSMVHQGNNPELLDPIRSGRARKEGTQNVTNVGDFFNAAKYLAPTSDIVALMTMEHQVRMINLITRVAWDTRIADKDGELRDSKTPEEVTKELNWEVDELVKYMLFAEEAPLKDPVKGVSTFTKTFAERGPRDKQGRSLRDFDLKTRLFKYPLSYLIYSAQFDALPERAKRRIYGRLHDVLTEQNLSTEDQKLYARLSTEDRKAVLEIVRETKQGLPENW
jgi:hypothetical protein